MSDSNMKNYNETYKRTTAHVQTNSHADRHTYTLTVTLSGMGLC